MQGSIAFDGTLSGSIAGGGGGGSEVTIIPSLTSGTKIADYEIDSTPGSLYAPTPESLTAQSPLLISSGVISIDLSDYDTAADIANTYLTQTDAATFYATKNEVTDVDTGLTDYVDSNFQPLLVAGANITIDADNVISASVSMWNYSTTEVNTGQKWIDGKDIYLRVFSVTPVTLSTAGININEIDLSGSDQILGGFATYSVSSNAKYVPLTIWRYNNQIFYAGMSAYVDTITVKYTKA